MGSKLKFEWDEAKRLANVARHGVDFADANLLDWEKALFFDQTVGGEKRTLSYAPIASRIYAIVITTRGDVTRIISFRKANQREVRRYVDSKKQEKDWRVHIPDT